MSEMMQRVAAAAVWWDAAQGISRTDRWHILYQLSNDGMSDSFENCQLHEDDDRYWDERLKLDDEGTSQVIDRLLPMVVLLWVGGLRVGERERALGSQCGTARIPGENKRIGHWQYVILKTREAN